MRILSISAVVLLSFLFLPQAVSACSCFMMASGNPPCQSFWSTPVVFSGRVSEIKTVTPDTGPFRGFEQRVVRFTVSGDHRGNVGPTAEVMTGRGGGDCGYAFELNQDYLVYAYKGSDGLLSTGICSATKPLDKAIDDIQYIGSLTSAKPVGSVFGQITQYKSRRSTEEYQPNPPVTNVQMTLEGKAGRFETVTDENGKYRLSDLLPGDYVLKFAAPEGFTASVNEQKVTIPEKGCVVMDFGVSRETSLSGRILDADGHPVSKIFADLVPIETISERYQKDTYSAEVDENGRFTFRWVPPGTYYLGIGLRRSSVLKHAFPRTFYPGTQIAENAVTVIIREGQVLRDLDFQLPPKLIERKVEGIVVFPDGKLAAKAYLFVEEGEYGNEAGGGQSGADGRFSLNLFEGLSYRVRAYISIGPSGEQRHAHAVSVPMKGKIQKPQDRNIRTRWKLWCMPPVVCLRRRINRFLQTDLIWHDDAG